MGIGVNMKDKLIIEKYASDGSKTVIRLDEPFISRGILCEFSFWISDELFIAFAVGEERSHMNVQVCTIADVYQATDLMRALC
jgi:hypothetical protein